MSNVVVVFPKIDDAKNIRNLLIRHGFLVAAVCSTGAQALNHVNALSDGIVVCGYRFPDMLYTELLECLPSHFEMLLLASKRVLSECDVNAIMSISMPLKVHELIETMNMMEYNIAGRKKKYRTAPRMRDPKEKEIIESAKKLLMERNHMSEEESHRYIQKCSMDSGTNMVETAEMILSIMSL